MPQPIDYTTFLANVNAADLAMLTTFIVGVSVIAATPAEADAQFVQANRLYDAGLLTELNRKYREVNGVLEQSYVGIVSPVAAGYVAKLARERVELSREPLP